MNEQQEQQQQQEEVAKTAAVAEAAATRTTTDEELLRLEEEARSQWQPSSPPPPPEQPTTTTTTTIYNSSFHQNDDSNKDNSNNINNNNNNNDQKNTTMMEDDDEEEQQSTNNIKYRQYLIDRTNGQSKLNGSTTKPPCCMCYVPKPVVWFADYIEQNSIFEKLGSFGCFEPNNLTARKYCIGLGLVFNIVGFIMSIFTCFAASTKFDLLWIAPFTVGSLEAATPDYYVTNQFASGVRAVAMNFNFTTSIGRVITTEAAIEFHNMCDYTSQMALDRTICEACAAVSSSITTTLFVSTVMCIPSITTSVLRLYPHYDCNCQKIFASFSAVISCSFALYTVLIYQFRCFRSIGQDINCLTNEEDVVVVVVQAGGTTSDSDRPDELQCPNGYSYVYRNAEPGIGWIMLMCACILKCLDMLLNFAIPTPTICRDHDEQRQYEITYYGKTMTPTTTNPTADDNDEDDENSTIMKNDDNVNEEEQQQLDQETPKQEDSLVVE